ncbi:MAG: DNA polymerase III subunit alpha [Prevotellaceae bacterium]|jgi:DNA polymerase-3 subunit alpha|nr:DNA polymerase III subunit alpha [Prevotellaceae bacterium]
MFVHLHVHTEYSILDGASKIKNLVEKAIADGMKAVAITDHGNMYGVKEFFDCIAKKNSSVVKAIESIRKQVAEAEKNGEDASALRQQLRDEEAKRFKPIIGCEVYVATDSRFSRKGKDDLSGDHLILLAKNKAGYHNLMKLVSLGFLEGFYGKPRIDKEILAKYREGLIVSSACLGGEIPQYLMNNDLAGAEKSILWFKELFGDDYYLELQRHKATDPTAEQQTYPKQQMVNAQLVALGQKLGVKLIATNDVHFVNEDEAQAHDRLLCISTAADVNDPARMRYTRQEWFKSTAEMQALFSDIPEAIANTVEVADKVEFYDINSKAIMPKFPLPEGFESDGDYLRHITFNGVDKGSVPGAKGRYPQMTQEIKDRIDFELDTMINMGFPGYFLIVQDFIAAAREMGVWVGPGRGSAAGSVVAYCLRITDIDPLKYDLLFERFLNPDRISMPDIDIDFDDNGRDKVLQYVTDKYGKEKVAQIVTFGTMAAKSAIKDVARVQKLPLQESNRLSGLIDQLPRSDVSVKNAVANIPDMKAAAESSDPLMRDTIKFAQILEGTVRNVGVHACGVIIGADDLTSFVPISTAEDKDAAKDSKERKRIAVTQYEGTKVEDVGLIKMDFLGLKTLSILKEAVANIKQSRGVDVNIDDIPIDDKATYELYSRGDTVGTFQFESDGMRKHLRSLQPTKFEDLIAMNALYRPGPMGYIPDFIDRKQGRKKIAYDIPDMEEYLSETYGITVYQEQVMLLSRKLAGFTRGQSDELRKAMGKKIREKLDALQPKFLEGCKTNGHSEAVVRKVWDDWTSFAEYAFNKSHATCYSWVAYQTAYLKANYPSEYMAALLSCNLSNIDEVSKFMDECKRMNIAVLSPDVNESLLTFTVNREGNIRFGMGAIKGVGGNAVLNIIEERKAHGTFKDIYDLVERVNLQSCSKKTLESLAGSGALDNLGIDRRAYLTSENGDGVTFIDALMRFGALLQQSKSSQQQSLFGGGGGGIDVVQKPKLPVVADDISKLAVLNRERELIGMYLSSHPLDEFKTVMQQMTSSVMSDFANIKQLLGRTLTCAGLVTKASEFISKKGNPYGRIIIEDFSGTHEFTMFGKDYVAFKEFLKEDYPLRLHVAVQERQQYGSAPQYGGSDASRGAELEVKVTKVELLSEIMSDGIKKVAVSIDIDEVTEVFIAELADKIMAAPKGKAKFCLKVFDAKHGVNVELFSRKYLLTFTNELERFFTGSNIKFSIS